MINDMTFRRLVGQRGARVVHLREQPVLRDRPRLRRPVHRDPHRDHGGEHDLQERGTAYGVPVGDAALSLAVGGSLRLFASSRAAYSNDPRNPNLTGFLDVF